ncbi:DUF2239 family protein [Ottowia sp.]|uniref:DUF2239 family protein n=1 Tax=Ottowia sp. TaxID=1898956 RepID=UPI002CBB388C|nr:DUF2239 family protein [Pseudomonadota bacterium]HOV20763.1 DUF2239 family protein [Ottowia sp.]
MNTIYTSRYTAFAGDRLLACGAYADIAQALASLDEQEQPVLVFDDATGAPVDAPPRPEHAALLARMGVDGARASVPANGRAAPRPSPGRPRLGVVAREVTLLPRHWDWLSAQPGGASAALRRLVDQARKAGESADDRRRAIERCYKFMNAIAGHRPGFEEATRALFAGERERFETLIAAWPTDVAAHARRLAAPGWLAPESSH